jgi:carbonic anhydrase
VEVVRAIGADRSDDEKMMMLLEQNVILQLQHLKTHPTVAVAMAKGELTLHGWVYDIKTGDVHAYDDDTGRFESVDLRYADEIRQILDPKH